jgi:DNA polymerase-4
MMNRDILHLAIPAFAIALARVDDPSLRERPVAIAPAHSERALLQCISSEARREGLFEGMPANQARRLCPSLKVLPPDPQLLARGSRSLLELTGNYSPVTEPSSSGNFFLDLTGCSRLLGPARDAASRMEREITVRLRLKGAVGVAGNKLVSAIASGYLDKPGVCDVLRGAERGFLAPLPVASLPGIGQQREMTLLRDLNLRHIGELSVLPVSRLRLVFGPFAPLLSQRAQGIDPSPVRPPKQTEWISEETFLSREDNDDAVLLAELCRLVEGCGLRLRRLGKAAGKLTLAITYADGVSEQRMQILTTHLDHDLLLYPVAETLFLKACRRRIRIRGMRLACTRLAGAGHQLDLFASSSSVSAQQESLQSALDGLRQRHGMQAVRWGRSITP